MNYIDKLDKIDTSDLRYLWIALGVSRDTGKVTLSRYREKKKKSKSAKKSKMSDELASKVEQGIDTVYKERKVADYITAIDHEAQCLVIGYKKTTLEIPYDDIISIYIQLSKEDYNNSDVLYMMQNSKEQAMKIYAETPDYFKLLIIKYLIKNKDTVG